MVWKRLDGEDYEVSTTGLVRNFHTKKLIKAFPGGTSPYLTVGLKGNGRKQAKRFLVHRLVAIAFLDNHHNLPEVNHIDGNKLNNDVNNLEWVSPKQNMKHALDNGLWQKYDNQFYKNKTGFDHNRSLAVKCSNGKIYGSISEACRDLKLNVSTVSYVIKRGTPMKNGLSFSILN